MNKITAEKTHDLLEKLADYVMVKIPAIENSLDRIEQQKADKSDVDKIMGVLDSQAQNIDIMRTERAAIF